MTGRLLVRRLRGLGGFSYVGRREGELLFRERGDAGRRWWRGSRMRFMVGDLELNLGVAMVAFWS